MYAVQGWFSFTGLTNLFSGNSCINNVPNMSFLCYHPASFLVLGVIVTSVGFVMFLVLGFAMIYFVFPCPVIRFIHITCVLFSAALHH